MVKIIDNINELLGDSLKSNIKPGAKVSIAASCFSIYAYEALKEQLQEVEQLRFIFTSPTFIESKVSDNIKKERREFYIPKLSRENSLYGTEFEVRLKNELTQRAIARECAQWIHEKSNFKSNNTMAPMQPFACVENRDSTIAYMPLSGFTAVDLGYEKGNAISNFVNFTDDAPTAKTYLNLFDEIWKDKEKLQDVTSRISEHISTVYNENAPEFLYFLILFNIFSEFLEDISEDVMPNDLTGYQDSLVWKKLFNFQKDAAIGIINKLETYNGCILADSVGLGKTFTALAVVKYYELRNKSVLVLCPKKLADNWLNYNQNLVTNIFANDRFNYTVLCHTDLQRTRGYSFSTPLNRINWGNFDLVVIDESHNFRNNDAFKERETRYQSLMNKVIKSGVKTKVLMLSATPVNNRFTDLRNQLALAYEGNSQNLSKKLRTERNIDEIFRRAQAVFNNWSKLPANERTPQAILQDIDFDFFKLLDSVTIARSRKHIQKYYDMSDIGPFPERLKPISYHSPLTMREDVIGYNEIFGRLIELNMSIYAPFRYIYPSRIAKYEDIYDTSVHGGLTLLKQADRERSLQTLMTVNMLKRLESSVEAFRISLRTLAGNINMAIGKIKSAKQNPSQQFEDIFADYKDTSPDFDEIPNLEDDQDDYIGTKVRISLSDMDTVAWENDLTNDLAIINALLSEMNKITPEDDAKLLQLYSVIDKKISSPINDNNRKVLIFTAFADTANYLFANLGNRLKSKYNIDSAVVTGSSGGCRSTLKRYSDFQTILTLFSPVSKEKEAILPEETNEFDILIGTDCISEGQNLQDCDYVVNYDIHWNPVRIIQRFGRIDRIGSPNKYIQLVNFWPDISLDEYIKLKDRVESRMIIADVAATGDENVLNSQANDLEYRTEQLKKLQDEVIDLEDIKTGVSITDLGLNDFRMDLVNYIRENGKLDNYPKGMHAIIPTDAEKGLCAGVIYVLRNINEQVNINNLNRLHPYYLVYISDAGEVVIEHTKVKKILDLLRASCKGQSSPIPELYQPFNKQTKDGRKMDKYSKLLEKSISSIIDCVKESEVDSLFSSSRATALMSDIKGLDDFELIAFVIVRH